MDTISTLTIGSEEYFKIWGFFFIKYLGLQVVAKIVSTILANIFTNVTVNEQGPKRIDERDRLIELKSVRNFSFVFGGSFMIAMFSLAFGFGLSTLFTIFAFMMILGELSLQASYIFFYERGY
jgi:hypothetical protein